MQGGEGGSLPSFTFFEHSNLIIPSYKVFQFFFFIKMALPTTDTNQPTNQPNLIKPTKFFSPSDDGDDDNDDDIMP